MRISRPMIIYVYPPGGSYSSMSGMGYGGYGSDAMASEGSGAYQLSSTGGYGSYSSSAPALANPVVPVAVYEKYYQPKAINVSVGTTVQWTNAGKHFHTVTSDGKDWDSGKLSPGEVFSYTFNRPGTYPYHCAIHPDVMRGVVVVKGSAPFAMPPEADAVTVSGPLRVPPPRRALINLRLPRNWASVSIDGREIDKIGKMRTYVTPELKEARTFHVAATWESDGRTVDKEDTVTVKAGQIRTLDFTTGK